MSDYSIVIPTLNAVTEIGSLLEILLAQRPEPHEIIVVDSSSDDGTLGVLRGFESQGVRTIVIDRWSFDHGGTRRMAVAETTGEFVLMLTQDAIPVGRSYAKSLLTPFDDPNVGAVCGRQIPKDDARMYERLVRNFNYPEESAVHTIDDIGRIGIKAFFLSDVCSAYRRSAYESCGGFPKQCNIYEDMYMAARLIQSGWKVVYAADAKVSHSHNLSPLQQYLRNREGGRFLEENAALFNCGSEVGEGMRMVGEVSKTLLREGQVGELCAFGVDCVARLLGNRAGRRAARKVMTVAPQSEEHATRGVE